MLIDKDKFKRLFWQFFKFGIVGVSNTAVSMAVYQLLLICRVNYMIANTVAFIVSAYNAYYWNCKKVFKAHGQGSAMAQVIKNYVAYTGTFLLSSLILWLAVEKFMVPEVWGQFVALPITIPINFAINKWWVYREPRKTPIFEISSPDNSQKS